MNKQKQYAFGKDIYLLGKDENDIKYWLEAPIWDCNWYWGFGYIETYTNNNNPDRSHDIDSHQHWEGTFLQGRTEPMWLVGFKEMKHEGRAPWCQYKEKPYYFYHREYAHNPYDNPYLVEKTFDKNEGWELGELFAQFYFLQKAAEMFDRGSAFVAPNHLQENFINWKDEQKVKEINTIIIPQITIQILNILTP